MRGNPRRARREGQGLVEYALVLGLVSVVSLAILSELGFNTAEAIGNLSDMVNGLPPGPGLCHGATLEQHLQHCGCPSLPHSCKATGWSC